MSKNANNEPIISNNIKKLYNFRKNDLQKLLSQLPKGTIIDVKTIKEETIDIETINILDDFGLESISLYIPKYLQAGGNIQELIKKTKGSYNHYEAEHKIKNFILEWEVEMNDEYEDEPFISFEDIINSIENNFEQSDGYYTENENYYTDYVSNNIQSSGKMNDKKFDIDKNKNIILDFNLEDTEIMKYNDIEFEDRMLYSEEGERIKTSTALRMLLENTHHPFKTEAICIVKYGVPQHKEITTEYESSTIEKLMSQIPGNNNNGIITINIIDEMTGENLAGNADFNIDHEKNTIEWSAAFMPAILDNPELTEKLSIILRVFNKNEKIEIINGFGKKMTVPRKYVSSWYKENNTFYGIESSEIANAHETDIEGNMLPPEEGVDYVSTHTFSIKQHDF